MADIYLQALRRLSEVERATPTDADAARALINRNYNAERRDDWPSAYKLTAAVGANLARWLLRQVRDAHPDQQISRARQILAEAENGVGAPHAKTVRAVVADVIDGKLSGEEFAVFVDIRDSYP